jgi:hypothetical protein
VQQRLLLEEKLRFFRITILTLTAVAHLLQLQVLLEIPAGHRPSPQALERFMMEAIIILC